MEQRLWVRVVDCIGRKMSPALLDSYVRPCQLVAVDGDHVRIAAPNKFVRDRLMENHFGALQAAFTDCIGGKPRITVVVDETLDAHPPAARDPAAPVPTLPADIPTAEGLFPRYTFETFVVGSSNQFAQAASQAVAELPSRAYNPLFIYGGVGLGKTHLLHAVGHQSMKLFPGMRVAYVTSERFTNDLIAAIRYDRTTEFRTRYRTIDLLLIDDIQFISGKERTQEEFFHTFNDLHEARKQIILSSDCSPKDIPEIEERLRSRFEWGLIADIQPPDFETRVAILKKKAGIDGHDLADDVAYLIASRVKSNIRELEGSLNRMVACSKFNGRVIGMELAQEVLADLWGEEEKVITIEQIQRKVSEHFNIRLGELKAKTRTQTVAYPRQIAMYLSRDLTHTSLAEIGRAFGGKDHTTVIHAVDKIKTLLLDDPKLRRTIDALIQDIKA